MDQRVEDLLREARKASRIDRERIEQFEGLIRSPGWSTYLQVLEAKIQMLADEVLSPAKSVDGMVGLEYVKGAMSGLIMARDIPSVTIAAKPDLIPVGADEEEDEDAA